MFGVLGCIDGTSINVRTPAHKIKSTYVKRHDIPSVTLQGICDYKLRFIDVCIGPPGKIHDARVFKLSFISSDLPHIYGKDYHIIGDNAYNLREYLLTPYEDCGALTTEEINYNKIFNGTRVLIENTFGILKGRFRQLTCLEFHSVHKMSKFIIACCVIHNLCIDNDDFIEVINEEIEDVEMADIENENTLRKLGEIKRNYVCSMLKSQ